MLEHQSIKDIIESVLLLERFKMSSLYSKVWNILESDDEIRKTLQKIQSQLVPIFYIKLGEGLLRHVFLIELVKTPKIESTKFRVRWCDELKNDPRFCSFEECISIFLNLLGSLVDWLKNRTNWDALVLSFENSLLPYELPVEYIGVSSPNGRIHTSGNIVWSANEIVIRTLKLRKYLTSKETSPDHMFFSTVLKDKICVKSYLTDRVLTGNYKTNREKRWETHPNSVHFALKRTCLEIEYTLITQICAFEGFPRMVTKKLQDEKILPECLETVLCPITGNSLYYEHFHNALMNPVHGKSNFQIGHLNPLKVEEQSNSSLGHNAKNISWISADGNRIQGNLSLIAVRALLKQVAENYNRFKW